MHSIVAELQARRNLYTSTSSVSQFLEWLYDQDISLAYNCVDGDTVVTLTKHDASILYGDFAKEVKSDD